MVVNESAVREIVRADIGGSVSPKINFGGKLPIDGDFGNDYFTETLVVLLPTVTM
jgi:hypothetical protein